MTTRVRLAKMQNAKQLAVCGVECSSVAQSTLVSAMTNTGSVAAEGDEASDGQLQQSADAHSPSNNRRWQLYFIVAIFAMTVLGALAVGIITGLSLQEESAENGPAPSNVGQPNHAFPKTPIDENIATSARPAPTPNSFDSCSDLKSDLRAAASALGNSTIDLVGIYYYKLGYVDLFNDSAVFTDDSSSSTRDSDSTLGRRRTQQRLSATQQKESTRFSSSSSWSSNTRYIGVEEADIVQSNGTDIFVAYGDEVIAIKAATMTISTRTVFPRTQYDSNQDSVLGILLVEDRLVIFTQQYGYGSYRDWTNTTVFVYDTNAMTCLTNKTIQGEYITAHAIGTRIHVTTSVSFYEFYEFDQTLGPAYIQSLATSPLDEESYRKRAHDELARQLDPFVDDLTNDLDCAGYIRSPSLLFPLGLYQSQTGSGLVTISSFDVLSPLVWDTTNMLCPGEEWHLISSQDHALMVSQIYFYDYNAFSINLPAFNATTPLVDPFLDILPDHQTYLVALKYLNATVVAASPATVPGIVDAKDGIDLFQKDRHHYLQVFSTSYDYASFDTPRRTFNPPLTMTVLKITEDVHGVMPIVSQVTGLGKAGDMIYATLFQGNVTIVASANDTDTLYMLNMSDSTNPQTIGELVVPGGHTSLLLDVGRDLILRIGAHGFTKWSDEDSGSWLLLLNMSNIGRPIVMDQRAEELASVENSSESVSFRFPHRYLVDQQILILPLSVSRVENVPCSDRESGRFSSSDDTDCIDGTGTFSRSTTILDGFRVFKINATNGISEYFSFEQPSTDRFWDGCTLASRSLVFGDSIVTLKGNSVLSHNLSTKSELARALNLKEGSNCSSHPM